MRNLAEIRGTREERIAQFKNDAELMGIATKFVSEVIEKAKEEAMRRRKSGTSANPSQIPTQDSSVDNHLWGASGEVPLEPPPQSQFLRVAFGNLKVRLSTAYGSLAVRLRNGIRAPLERGRSATERLRVPFSTGERVARNGASAGAGMGAGGGMGAGAPNNGAGVRN